MTQSELEALLKKESRDFINEHLDDDPELIALKFRGRTSLPIRAISEQIRSAKKAAIKLPRLSRTGLLYEKTALEQASSELTAGYKAGLYRGDKMMDLTGGLGIDDIFFSESFKEVVYCEQNSILSKIFKHNINLLGKGNIRILEGDSIELLKDFPDDHFDLIYADPARRDETRRFIGLKSCSPDVVENMELMLKKSAKVLIKASPAIEAEEVKRQFRNLKEFTVLSVDNECREVLLYLNRNIPPEESPAVKAVLIDSHSGTYRTFAGKDSIISEKNISPKVLPYFYEPDSAIIKARLSGSIAEEFSLYFINGTIDFLTSGELKKDFPGRIFEVKNVFPYKPEEIKKYLKENGILRANVSRRDFPEAPEKIKKILGLKDGGEDYLFFTKDSSNKPAAIFCRKAQK